MEVTNSPRVFNWAKEYGLKLTIPQQSLPDNIKSCTITVRVSLSGQYEFPEDAELVSPVFWLSCEPQCNFTSPLSLEIKHCALPENSCRLRMARAVSSQINLPYSFKAIRGIFSEPSPNLGLIELDSLSGVGVGVVQKGSKERRYWSDEFYMDHLEGKNIHFTVTWHDNAHIQVSSIAFFFPNMISVITECQRSLYIQRSCIWWSGTRICLQRGQYIFGGP